MLFGFPHALFEFIYQIIYLICSLGIEKEYFRETKTDFLVYSLMLMNLSLCHLNNICLVSGFFFIYFTPLILYLLS